MSTLLSLFACIDPSAPPTIQPQDYEVAPTDPNLIDPDDYVEASSSPTQLEVSVPEGIGGVLEVSAFRAEEGSFAWQGGSLSAAAVDDTTWTVTLPQRAPASHRLPGENEVTYALALRDTDEAGTPTAYMGVSDVTLVWSYDQLIEEATWSIVFRMGFDEEETLELDAGTRVDANLREIQEVTLSGFNNVQVPDTHLTASVCSDTECGSVFDTPLGPDAWSLSVGGAPPDELLGDESGVNQAIFSLSTYLDEDGDNRLTDEYETGVACLGQEEVVLGWFQTAFDLESAMEMRAAGIHSGWEVYLDTSDGLVMVAPEFRTNVIVASTCQPGAAP